MTPEAPGGSDGSSDLALMAWVAVGRAGCRGTVLDAPPRECLMFFS